MPEFDWEPEVARIERELASNCDVMQFKREVYTTVTAAAGV
jgi:hypothetical protein